VVIRAAVPPDAAGIAEVHVASWHETYRGTFPDALIDRMTVAHRTRQWIEWLTDATGRVVRVAETDGRIVGFAVIGPAGETADFAGLELLAFYLLARHHGTGVGRALFRAALDGLPEGTAAIGINVLSTNARARRFYEAAGAVAVREKPVRFDGVSITDVGYRLDLPARL
jgi:GNAT superfamily N-acetyltransferase